MYRLLLPVDDDPDLTRGQAVFVANLPGTEEMSVVLTHALTPAERDAGQQVSIDRIDTIRLARDYLEDRGIAVEAAEARTPPAEGILELADEFDVDHVVIGSQKRSPTGKAVFGSVAQTVVLDADVPVTVVGAAAD